MSTLTTILRHRRARRERAHTGVQRLLRWLSGIALAVVIALTVASAITGAVAADVYASYVADLPAPEELERAFNSKENNEFFQTTKIYDRKGPQSGALLYEVIDPRGGDRQWLALEQIPPALRQATIAIEDKTFYDNPGYDLEGILRALVSNLRGGPIQGGSTITQQLVKNVLIGPGERSEKSYSRKIREIILAGEITRRYSKDQILEWYLNTNFYGNLAYGIDAAALVYFGKHATQLDLAEAAMLAAIPQYPRLNPIDAPEEAKRRQALVLSRLLEEGYITAAQAEAASAEPLKIQSAQKRFDIQAPHFSVHVRDQLVQMFGEDVVNRGGLRVTTTLDLDLQRQAECVVANQIARLSGGDPNIIVPTTTGADCAAAQFLPPPREGDLGVDHHVTNAAVMALRPATGEILAMVGSADYWNDAIDGRFNVAVDGRRQPGSSFKPLSYLTAFALGYTPATMLLDVRQSFNQYDPGCADPSAPDYVPEDYDRQAHGPVRMRVALARSYNIPAVQTMSLVGIDEVLRTAHRMGISTLGDEEKCKHRLGLALGSGEVSLLDMTYAYSVLANSGVMAGGPIAPEDIRAGFRRLNPVAILRVEDANGKILYEYNQPDTQQILSPPLAYLTNNVLSDEEARYAAFGHPNPLEIGRPAGAKTGTTNDFRDNWTLGYTPQIAVGVWVGNTDFTQMQKVTGLTGAAPIWHAVMQYATQNLPVATWALPPGVSEIAVCDPSGLLPTRYCPNVVKEAFITGTEPTAYDNLYQLFRINRETGKLATVFTPPDLVDEKVFLIPPPEAADWARDSGLAQPPTEYDTVYDVPPSSDAIVASPAPFAYVSNTVSIVGTAKVPDDNFSLFRLQYGAGLNPSQWFQIGGDRGDQVENGELGQWDTSALAGLYTLQLVVVRKDQSFAVATVQVTVDNQRPTATILQPQPSQTFRASDESIVIQPQVQDNFRVDRVEFIVDGDNVNTATVPPYAYRWKITGAGDHTIYVKVYDGAGNSAESERVTVRVTR
ncbi:MAG: transglycosylase domain-containing protein [Chloroflexi bacterium]|nr:transglycosylase domain-containing protein [Chloroflexota bacterium]